ncbi:MULTISPECIES: DHA2 family efflux MFS transporter permease subunit [Pseudomonas]|nr:MULTISPECIES: DHA2 family efflux MFS transporter permease subunit [Pseudomonas]
MMAPARAPVVASRRLVVVAVILGTTTVSLNNTSLNPALPAFIEAFELGPVMATWIVAAFMVSMGMTMPLTGYLAQRVGRKLMYLAGLALFVAGSLLGAMADSIAWVITARVVQGIASGLMIPLSLAIIFSVYPKGERGAVTGLWGAAVMLAPAVGPLCGSLVLQGYDWRALFLVNVPIGLLAFGLGVNVLPRNEAGAGKPFDLTGYLLVAVGIGVLMLTVGQLRHMQALQDPLNLLGLLLAAACLLGFVRHQLRHTAPLLELRIFALKGYRSSVIIAVVQSIGMFECLVLVPLLVQMVMGHSAIWTGIALLCTALSASLFGHYGGRLLDRHGPRGIVSLGLLLTGLPTFALGTVDHDVGMLAICLLMVVRGAGLGLSYMPVTTAGLDVLPEALITQGAAMNNISRRLLSSLAIVLASLWLQIRLGDEWGAAHAGAVHSGAAQAGTASAIGEVFIATAVLILLALPFAWRFPHSPSNDPVEQGSALSEHRS